jgi:putative nucleotidyltransferase with HDIG domain
VLTEKSRSLKRIRPLPTVAVQLVRLVSGDQFSYRIASKLIRADVAFSAELLRIANSPLFACEQKVDTLDHALIMLGMDRLKSLVMTVALRNFLSSAGLAPTFRRCWRHSIACACACEELAAVAGCNTSTAYTSGLLHDVGRLGLLASYPAEYTGMLDAVDEHGYDVLESERELFDLDHCQAGCLLVRDWALPEEFEAITGSHHLEPAEGPPDDLMIVQLGCRMADALGFSVLTRSAVSFADVVQKLPGPAAEQLGSEDEVAVKISRMTATLECDM